MKKMTKNLLIAITLTLFTLSLLNTSAEETPLRIFEHRSDVYSIAFSPDGNTLASGGQDGTLFLWDAQTGEFRRELEWHRDHVSSIAFSPDGNTLVSGSGRWDHNYYTVLWSFHPGITRSNTIGNYGGYVAFSRNGNHLAVSGNTHVSIRVPQTGNRIFTLPHGYYPRGIAFSHDGSLLAGGSSGEGSRHGIVRIWNPHTGERLREIEYPNDADEVTCVAFLPWLNELACGVQTSEGDHVIHIWNAQTGEFRRTLEGHTGYITSLTPSWGILASGSMDGTVRLWDQRTGENIRTFTGHRAGVTCVAFSPGGSTLASGSFDTTVRLWSLAAVSLSPTSVLSPAVGKPITFDLVIEDTPSIAGYQATVQFDPTALRYVEGTYGDFLPDDAFFVPPVVEDNTITFAANYWQSKAFSGDGTLATLTFEVRAGKMSTLTLRDVLLFGGNDKIYYPHLRNAQISVDFDVMGDVNQDGTVNVKDLVVVAENFGKTGENTADVNGDDVVNIVDLALVGQAILFADAGAPSIHALDTAGITATQVQQWLRNMQQADITDANTQQSIRFFKSLLAVLTLKETALLPNYPNPFNPETWIPYQLAKPADVSITIFAADGRLVRTLVLGHQLVGIYESRSRAAYWDGRNALGEPVASGVYFYTLTAGDFTATRKMLIKK